MASNGAAFGGTDVRAVEATVHTAFAAASQRLSRALETRFNFEIEQVKIGPAAGLQMPLKNDADRLFLTRATVYGSLAGLAATVLPWQALRRILRLPPDRISNADLALDAEEALTALQVGDAILGGLLEVLSAHRCVHLELSPPMISLELPEALPEELVLESEVRYDSAIQVDAALRSGPNRIDAQLIFLADELDIERIFGSPAIGGAS